MRSPTDYRARLLPILLSQIIGLACGLAGVRLVSKWIAPEDYGAYGVFITLGLVGSGVIYAGLVKYVSRHWQDTPDRARLAREVFASMVRKSGWLLATAALAGTFVAPHNHLAYGALLFGCAWFLGLLQLAQSALQAARENWADFGVSAGASLSRSFAPPLFYHASGAGLVALLGGFLLHATLSAALGCWAVARWWRGGQNHGTATRLPAIYDGPRFVITALVAWTLAGLNRWIAAWFFGTETAGYFTLATNVGAIIPTMLGAVVLQYFQPKWFAAAIDTAEARRKLWSSVNRVALLYTALAVLAAAGLHAGMPLLIGTLVDARYTPSVGFILGTTSSAAALMLGSYFHVMLIAAKEEQACMRVDLSGAGCLALGAIISGWLGVKWFTAWLAVSPIVPWLVNWRLARHALLKGSAS